MKEYTTIEKEVVQETIIKKSRFIGALFPVDSPEEAASKLEAVKKKYWDATHNCSAYILGDSFSLMRFSDDGEPQGTAGIPMLEVLKQSGITNILAIVTRYFGGVLLGAGGLVRAYSGSVAGALQQAQKIKMVPCIRFQITLPYASYGRMESLVAASGITKAGVEFLGDVQAELLVPQSRRAAFEADVQEAFLGSIVPREAGQAYQAVKIE